MARVLFVSNGHGEASIADRIAEELRAIDPELELDHLALVGDAVSEHLRDVGPQRAMPSGGLIAMGNVRNIARDVRSGLLALTWAQYRYLRRDGKRYDVAVAIGDVYALLMTLCARRPAIFVGTAKSVYVAPYGPVERRLMSRAARRFVRDAATADRLREAGLETEPAANVIVDLFATAEDPNAARATDGFDPAFALFPGSRESAYEDATFLLDVVARLAGSHPSLGAVLSVARGLDDRRFAGEATARGWQVELRDDASVPFVLSKNGRPIVRAWRGALGPVLGRVSLVLGQAGTANEAAAAAGIPVIAFESDGDRKASWYRERQAGLLGDALIVLPRQAAAAALSVDALVRDPQRRAQMGAAGRERMGEPGAARRIAEAIVALAGSHAA